MRTLILFPTLFFLIAAAPADDLQLQIDAAKAEVRNASDRLNRAKDRLRQCDDYTDGLRRRANLLSADADRLNADAVQIERDSAQAQVALPRFEQRLNAVNLELPALNQALQDAQAAAAGLAATSAQRLATMQAEFEVSERFQSAKQRTADSDQQLNARLTTVKQTVSEDPTYRAHRDAADRLKLEIDAMRKSPGTDPQSIANRSTTWMSAETRAGEFFKKAEAADEELKALRQQAADARQAERKLIDQFEVTKSADPALRQLAAERQAAQTAISMTQAQLRQQESERSVFERQVREAKQFVAGADAQARAARHRAEALRRDYDETMRFCRSLEAGSRWVRVESFGRYRGLGRVDRDLDLKSLRDFLNDGNNPRTLFFNGNGV